MTRALGLIALLAAMWWFWSGYTYALTIGSGIASCLLVAWLSNRMNLLDNESLHLKQVPGITSYWVWLIIEIIKSNAEVCHRILTGNIRPAVRALPVTQKTDQGRANYANSITLTPGTLSYELESDVVHVHALDKSSLDELEKGKMAKQVDKTEYRH